VRTFGTIVIACVSLFFTRCSQSPKCWGNDKNNGIIESSVEVPCSGALHDELTINSEAEFKSNVDSTCTIPSIDFNENTLLGVRTTFGCNAKFIREVTKDEVNHLYNYKVIVKECGACKRLGISYNWVLVPKLPQDWRVSFKVVFK